MIMGLLYSIYAQTVSIFFLIAVGEGVWSYSGLCSGSCSAGAIYGGFDNPRNFLNLNEFFV